MAYNISKWRANNRWQINLCFSKKTDADVIDRLKSVKNKTAYIRWLIRKDMTK